MTRNIPLVSEMKRILDENPSLASSAMELLDLYLCLWDCYIVKSTQKIRLEEEYRVLRDSNAWLAQGNSQLHQACADRELLLWNRLEAFNSLGRGIIAVLQSSERFPSDMIMQQ